MEAFFEQELGEITARARALAESGACPVVIAVDGMAAYCARQGFAAARDLTGARAS